jgi:HD superfamily phosphodiesterase
MRRNELWLLLFLVAIAAVLNFLAASQHMALVFYFLPVMFSAYYFGRRHATLTACVSVALVVLLTFLNPVMFTRKADLPLDSRYFDLTVWGGILVVTGYAMGTLYERNQKTLSDMKNGYDSMLVILQHLLSHEKYSEAHAYRVSLYTTKIAEAMGLDPQSTEDVRTAALLHNVSQLGISHDTLFKAANVSHDGLTKAGKAEAVGNTLQRAIPIFNTQQQLKKTGQGLIDAPIEVQVLAVADAYETLISGVDGRKLSPQQAEEIITKSSGKKYDSMVVDAFAKAFGEQAKGTGA